jgi:VWFA-related protein
VRRLLILTAAVAALGSTGHARQAAPQPPQPSGAQQRPVFRAGAHYVRVDAYPTGKDGRILEGLTKDDFEIYEDGKPQTIEKAELITFDTWTPEAERKDPRTQQDAYDLLADPAWRVFVIVIDREAYGMEGQHYVRAPLHQFIERNLGPRDLFGLLTTENAWTDLVLGQKTTVADAVLDSRDWYDPTAYDERFELYYQCGIGLSRKRLDDTYTLLEGLVKLLGLIREEKKSILFVATGLATPGPDRSSSQSSGMPFGLPGVPGMPGAPGPPSTPGPRVRPPAGGTGGGSTAPIGHGDRIVTPSREANCAAERMRLANIDFGERFRELLQDARRANVAFYPISPAGLQTVPFKSTGGVDMDAFHHMNPRTDTLLSLASETDGIAVVNTNGFERGIQRIANDVQAYYVLGYYTSNTKWDGAVRSIKVRLKPKGSSVRARRQYRAPTLEEITAIVAGPSAASGPPKAIEIALKAIDRKAPAADGPRVTLVGEPQAFRFRGHGAPEPAGLLHFARDERLRVEWEVKQALDRHIVRLLDHAGRPLPVDVPLSEGVVPGTLFLELPMSAFARADYVVELTVGAGAVEERSLVAFRVE